MTIGRFRRKKRRGAIAVFAAMLMVTLIAMVAFAVDFGYLLSARADLQRAADAAALAAVRDLLPSADGSQDFDATREAVREYAALNQHDASFTVLDSDIEIGRYDPETVYTNFTILSSGTFDTVRVTLRRDTKANAPVSLFFARIFGINNCNISVTATAVLQKGSILEPGVGILPIAVPEDAWNWASPGDAWNVYGDGRLEDELGNESGNWGTADIGLENNSTEDIRDQILDGLRQKDLDALYAEDRILTSTHIDSREAFDANGDTGFSEGIKKAINKIIGQERLIPIYRTALGSGGNLEFYIVGWGVCEIGEPTWRGANNSYVNIKKSYTYDAYLRPQTDLSITDGIIEGAFTSPVLVE